MIRIADRIPTENLDWTISRSQLEFKNDIKNIMTIPNLELISLNMNATVYNPFSNAVFMMLAVENPPTKVLGTRINYTKRTLHSIEDLIDISKPKNHGDILPTKTNLTINKIVEGTNFIRDNELGNELKGVSIGLQHSQHHKIRVFRINENNIQILTNSWGWELWYKIVALLPQLLPASYPNVSKELTDTMIALAKTDHSAFVENFNKWLNINKIEDKIELERFTAWLNQRQTQEIARAEQLVQEHLRVIEDYNNALSKKYVEQRKAQETLFGLKNYNKAEDQEEKTKEIVTYLRTNKALSSFNIDLAQNRLYFTIVTPIRYVDPDAFIKNYYKLPEWQQKRRNVMELFNEAFVEEKATITVTAKIWLDLNRFICGSLNIDEDNGTLKKEVWAPHYGNGFHCFGNNAAYIIKALKEYDIIGAVEQCIAAVMNLNFFDPPVIEKFIREIEDEHYNKPFITLEDSDKILTYEEYKEILYFREHPPVPEPAPIPKKKTAKKKEAPETDPQPTDEDVAPFAIPEEIDALQF